MTELVSCLASFSDVWALLLGFSIAFACLRLIFAGFRATVRK